MTQPAGGPPGNRWHTRGVPACDPRRRERRDRPQQPRQDVRMGAPKIDPRHRTIFWRTRGLGWPAKNGRALRPGRRRTRAPRAVAAMKASHPGYMRAFSVCFEATAAPVHPSAQEFPRRARRRRSAPPSRWRAGARSWSGLPRSVTSPWGRSSRRGRQRVDRLPSGPRCRASYEYRGAVLPSTGSTTRHWASTPSARVNGTMLPRIAEARREWYASTSSSPANSRHATISTSSSSHPGSGLRTLALIAMDRSGPRPNRTTFDRPGARLGLERHGGGFNSTRTSLAVTARHFPVRM